MRECNVYLEHWSLKRQPFDARPDSRFLQMTPRHEHALAALSYSACEGGEPVLLRGPAGCGKTLLMRALRRQLSRETFHVAFVPETACAQTEFLQRVTHHLTHETVLSNAAAMSSIAEYARRAGECGEALVLMFDNWPVDADPRMLEELRWLLNVDIEQDCRLSVLIAGEGIRPRKHWPSWLVQRLFTTVQVGPLEPEEVAPYLAHRLCIAAGAPADDPTAGGIITPDAAAEITHWSHGVPRLVNRAAHLALQTAYLERAKLVSAGHVRCAIERMNQPISETPSETAESKA